MSDLRLMSREFLTEFIDVYKQNDCLWKIKSKDYSDKQKKNAAYTILIDKLKEVDPQANKDAVIKKINSLRTCFRKELKKYTTSLRSGAGTEDIQKPSLWYFDLLLFLTDQEMPRQDGRDNISSPCSESEENVDLIEEGNNTNANEANEVDEPSRPKSTHSQLISSSEIVFRPSSGSVKRKKSRADRSDEVLDIIANSLQTTTPVQTETVGKYGSFGKYVAQELQELSPEMAIYCKKLINEAIFHAQLGNLTVNSRITTGIEPVLNNTLDTISCSTTSTPLQSSILGTYYSQYQPENNFQNTNKH